jgi:protein-tyrosine kinase
MDAVLLVAGVGMTSVADIKECHRHLAQSNILRVVVNKDTESPDDYYGYY